MKTKAKPKSAVKRTAVKVLKAVKRSASRLAPSRSKAAPTKLARTLKKAATQARNKVARPASKVLAVKSSKLGRTLANGRKRVQHVVDAASSALANMLSEPQIRRMSVADYMNEVQLEFFRRRLLQMREEVLAREVDVKERLHQREVFADPADRASAEEEHWLDLRLRERESLLLRKIEEALRRIKDKEYGYCEVTGEPIGIPRLLARPTATVCVDVKGHNEQIESQFRDR